MLIPITSLNTNLPAVIKVLNLNNSLVKRLMSLGIYRTKIISLLKKHDNIVLIAVDNAKIAISTAIAKKMEVEPVKDISKN